MGHSPQHPPPSVVTPGNHDGVHAGHRCLVAEARQVAASSTPPLRVVALTFHPHPMQLVAPERAPGLLTTPERRVQLLRGAGADEVIMRRFDSAFASLSPEEFVTSVLRAEYGARSIVVGDDFRFGKNRAGNVSLLQDLGARCGLDVVTVPKIFDHGDPISSSRIRALLASGDVVRAAELLTRVHDITQTVIVGHQRGRTIGVPTANLQLGDVLVPADGVYAVVARLTAEGVGDSGPTSGPLLYGTANLGVRPTVAGGRSLEVHLHDFDADLYGRSLRVGFVARIRDEQKFSGLPALRAQIASDIAASRRISAECKPELLGWM